MRIELTRSAVKEARKVPVQIILAIAEKLGRYAENQEAAVDVSALKGEQNAYRLRHGDYRALFVIEDDVMTVTAIRSRGDAYK